MRFYCIDKELLYEDGLRCPIVRNQAVFTDERSARLWSAVLNFAANLMPVQAVEYNVHERNMDIREVK